MIISILIALSILMFTANSAAMVPLNEHVEEVVLENGFTFLLLPRADHNKVAAGWVVRFGSANEQPGLTGMAHFFEHLLFKGSSKIGTNNYQEDYRLRLELDALWQRIQNSSFDAEQYAAAQENFEQLLAEQQKYVLENELNSLYADAGATNSNALSDRDKTVFFVEIPKNKLELWFWLESDRIKDPVFRSFYREKSVIAKERALRIGDRSPEYYDTIFNALFWYDHSYAWPVMGWPDDLAAISRQQAQAFFQAYYVPENITFALVGDFKIAEVKALAIKYFGRIKAGSVEDRKIVKKSTRISGEIFYQVDIRDQSQAEIRYRTVPVGHKDQVALQALAGIMSSQSGPLYRRLITERKIASSIDAKAIHGRYGGSFNLYASARANVNAEQLRVGIVQTVAKIKKNGITEKALQGYKNHYFANQYHRFKAPFYLLVQLLFSQGVSSWRDIDRLNTALNRLTTADIHQAAKSYLFVKHRATKLFNRVKGVKLDPKLMYFTSTQRQQIKQMIGQLLLLSPQERQTALIRLQNQIDTSHSDNKALYQYVYETITTEAKND